MFKVTCVQDEIEPTSGEKEMNKMKFRKRKIPVWLQMTFGDHL